MFKFHLNASSNYNTLRMLFWEQTVYSNIIIPYIHKPLDIQSGVSHIDTPTTVHTIND